MGGRWGFTGVAFSCGLSEQSNTDRNGTESYRLPNRPVKTKPTRLNDTKEDKTRSVLHANPAKAPNRDDPR